MKKIILSAIIMLAIATTSFAMNNEVNSKVLQLFSTEFKKAENVRWVTFKEYTEAIFTMNGQRMTVFYNQDGEKVSSGRNIEFEELPINAIMHIENKYAGYTTGETVEYNGPGEEHCYYTYICSGDKKLILKISSSGNYVSVFKKLHKK